MIQQIKSYLKFIIKAQSEHGIHSPFVFNLITQCFYDNTNYPEYEVLKNYRKTLSQNKNTIEVTDFGAGSRVFKSNIRQISAIAKTAGISAKNAELLFRIVRYFQPETILEIGTSLGLATSALSLGNPEAKITTLEGCPNTLSIAKNQLQNMSSRAQSRDKTQNLEFINTEFLSYLQNNQHLESARCDNRSTKKLKTENWQLIYFDGNHSQKATLEYFELLLPTATNDSVWIFDDIHWSTDMETAWKEIKNHPQVTVTIDTFQWGIVFFRKEQQKQHFIINPKRNISSFLFKKIKI